MQPLKGFALPRGRLIFPNATRAQVDQMKGVADAVAADEVPEETRERYRREIANRGGND